MSAKNPMIPSQTIHVEFVRLQDLGYEDLENLFECKLCDTINVVFPDYGTSGQFKIVKTVWDVLADRYESMELGDLSVTLAEALGISSDGSRTSDADEYVIDTVTQEDISVPASTGASVTIDASKNGCTPVGILQINKSGSANGYCVPSLWYISSNNVYLYFRNTSSSAATVNLTLTILYKRG